MPPFMPSVTAIQKHVVSVLKAGLPVSLTYHNIAHTLDVAAQCIAIAKEEGITDKQVLKGLHIAALYHDMGFLYVYRGHEEISCTMAKEQLPAFGVAAEMIETICQLIMATKIPQAPKNKLQQIICDADLDYLGRDDFYEISQKLQQEVLACKIVTGIKEWKLTQIKFLRSHHYFTQTSRQKRTPVKMQHVKKLIDEQKGISH